MYSSTLTDALSFEMMRRRKLRRALALDRALRSRRIRDPAGRLRLAQLASPSRQG
jgi:hypothetical protein